MIKDVICIVLFLLHFLVPDEFNLSVDLKSPIYCTAVSQCDESDWNYLWDKYQSESSSPSEKNNILLALTCSNQPKTLQVSENIIYVHAFITHLETTFR